MTKERNKSIDIARGIAMIAIVLGHLGIANINRVVFTFHIPIFYLITGYFLTTKHSTIDVIKKRFRTLIVPYFLACLGVICFAVFFALLRHNPQTSAVALQWIKASLYGAGDAYQKPFTIYSIGAIWFLWATFWGVLFLRLILNMKASWRVFLVLALFVIGYFSRSICWFPFSIQAGCCATFFMYIGYLVRQIKPVYDKVSSEIKITSFIACMIVWITFMIQFQSFWLVHCDIGRGPLDVLASLCACYALMVICEQVAKASIVSDGLAYLGQYSLFMLVAHIIELDTFPWGRLTGRLAGAGMSSTGQMIIMVICKFIWIIVVTIICSKTNWIRKLFGMKPLKKKDKISQNVQ